MYWRTSVTASSNVGEPQRGEVRAQGVRAGITVHIGADPLADHGRLRVLRVAHLSLMADEGLFGA
jgi:hypothetical protein